ncbi:MAG: hypothetical protein OHK93_001184 [Ramalina farinacea]|uniref:Uncharacterized protein n=1 Tax=Ramalina farinacea TaxID=258253 RepID=A0AA43QP11_9LECA|nr:hypothetical protein [Ramalina farinacea]
MTSKATINSNEPHALASRRTGKSYPPNEELELANAFVRDAFRDEGQARDLFHLYMANCPQFSPIVDPNFDTFDSLRQRSAFCLVAILSVATSVDSSITSPDTRKECKDEADKLAARTLQNYINNFQRASLSADERKQKFLLFREVRVWVVLQHMEREIALGTGREPRCDRIPVAQLRQISSDIDFPPAVLRSVATAEIMQLRRLYHPN